MPATSDDLLKLGFALGPGGVDAANRFFDQFVNSSNTSLGTVAGTGVTGAEYNSSIIHETVITLSSLVVTMTDGGASGSIGSQKIYDMPTGLIQMIGARTNLTSITAASGITATATVKHSVGTIPAATNDTLNLTKANIIPSTSVTLAASTGSVKGLSQSTAITALTDNSGGSSGGNTIAVVDTTPHAADAVATLAAKVNELVAMLTLSGNRINLIYDGTSSAMDIYLNFGVADAGSTGNSSLTVSGTVTLTWVMLASA